MCDPGFAEIVDIVAFPALLQGAVANDNTSSGTGDTAAVIVSWYR